MKTLQTLMLRILPVALLLSACAEGGFESPDVTLVETQSEGETAQVQSALVYGPGDKPMCEDEDESGLSFQGAPYNAPPRPLWSEINIPHPSDQLVKNTYDDECNVTGTETIQLWNIPTYKDPTRNLNVMQSLQFFISIAQNVSTTLENASEAVAEGEYVDSAIGWVENQVIPQTVGHCVCIGNCAPSGCDPDTILDRVEQAVDEILNDLNLEDLLQDFLTEKLDPLITDLENIQDYIEDRFTDGALITDILGNTMRIALQDALEDAIASLPAADQALCQGVLDGTWTTDIDGAMENAMSLVQDAFDQDVQALMDVIDAWNTVVPILPDLKDKVTNLIGIVQGIEKLTDLLNFDPTELQQCIDDITTVIQDVWPEVQAAIDGITTLWDDLTNLQNTLEQLADDVMDSVFTDLTGNPNTADCIDALINNGLLTQLGPGDFDMTSLGDAFAEAIQDEWDALLAQLQPLQDSIEACINGLGTTALNVLEDQFNEIKDTLIAAALDGCYTRTFRSDCYDFCDPGGVEPPETAPQTCFLWMPVDFLESPEAAVGGAASAALWALKQVGFLDGLVQWLNDNINTALSDALGDMADVAGTVTETLDKVLCFVTKAFSYIDLFMEGYHLGAYTELRPDLHMCIGYAGHGAYAQMGNLGGDNFSIGARYTSHNVSKENRVQYRSGGFAVSAFGHELSLLPGIEVNAQIQGFKIWNPYEPFGIPLNVPISAELLARLDSFATSGDDTATSGLPFDLPVDGSGEIPLGAFLVRDLYPVPNSATEFGPGNAHIWPRQEVSNVWNPAATPWAPEWESSAIATVSLGVNLKFDLDPPQKYLPPITIVPGILVAVPWWDISAGVEWKHQCNLYRDRILEKVNENLPAPQQLDAGDFVRDMHAMAPDDLTGDNGTYAYVEPGIGFDLFAGFNLWKVYIGAYASLGLYVNIRPGGTGGIVDMNSALADALLHSNPPADAPCTPVIETVVNEQCNSQILGGNAETTYACTTGDSSCCITAMFDPPEGEHIEYSACIDDWTGFDQGLCEEFNSVATDVTQTFSDIMTQAPGHSDKLDKLLDKLAQLGIGEKSVTATWNEGVRCEDSQCGANDTIEGGGPVATTAILDLESISECELHGYCILENGDVVHDVDAAECLALREEEQANQDPDDPPQDEQGEPCPGERYTQIDIGTMVCSLYDKDQTGTVGNIRCWYPDGYTPGAALPTPAGSGFVDMECDSGRCAWSRDPDFGSTPVDFVHGPAPFGYTHPDSCQDPLQPCYYAFGPVYDSAIGHEGTVGLNLLGALRWDNDNCQDTGFNFPTNAAVCTDEFLTITLGCNGVSTTCTPEYGGEPFQQVEYTAQTMCGILRDGNDPWPHMTPAFARTPGNIRCAWPTAPVYSPIPGSPSSCGGVTCPEGYTCKKTSNIDPVCVLNFDAKNYTVQQLIGGQPEADWIDVASVGNNVVCGLHSFDGSNPLQAECLQLNDDWNTCNPQVLSQEPSGPFIDIEPGGVCTMCALKADRSGIVCWGDEVMRQGQTVAYVDAPVLPDGSVDIFIDMGGLSDKHLWDLNPGVRPWVACGVTQSGKVVCSDPAYEPTGGVNSTDCGGEGDGASGDQVQGGVGWHPYMCYQQVDYEITGWEGDGCHPLQHGFASACGCAADIDCSSLNGETCNTETGLCETSGTPMNCECTAGSCPPGRVCVGGACAHACANDADCATNYECNPDGACVPKHGIPYAETITWGMANVEAPMHTINSYAMSDIYATLIMTLGVGVGASFKLFGKVREWTLFEYNNAWDLGSTWKGWYQPGLEARYQDECSDPDLQTTMTNRFPRSLTSNPYDAHFDTGNVPILRNCPNGGVCRYPEDLPPSVTPSPGQPWQYPAGNAGSVEDFVLWCKEDMKEHKENPTATTPEDLVDSIVETYRFGEDVSFSIYAQNQPCIDGQPITQWMENLYPTYDENGNVVDEGSLGSQTCTYDDPQTGTVHSFPCKDITANMMRIWGCLDPNANPWAASLWSDFPELRQTTAPDGTPQNWIDIDAMFWPTAGTSLSNDYSQSTMKVQYLTHFDWSLLPFPPSMVGHHWLTVVNTCFDARFLDPAETKCECTTDADCNTQVGEICGNDGGCMQASTSPGNGQTEYQAKECPIVSILTDVGQCCGDGVVSGEPVQVMAPAEPGSAAWEAHHCDDNPGDDPVCVGLYYVEQCDDGPNGSPHCSPTCELLAAPPSGACCGAGACYENLNAEQCSAQVAGGVYHPGVTCAALDYCEQPNDQTGGCCLPSGQCMPLTAGVCAQAGGNWNAAGCDSMTCEPANDGACCVEGLCVIYPNPTLCANKGGIWLAGQTCDSAGAACEQAWACCRPSGECGMLTAPQCAAVDGVFSFGLTCDQVPCEGNGAACPGSPVSPTVTVSSRPGYAADGPKIVIASPGSGLVVQAGGKTPLLMMQVEGATVGSKAGELKIRVSLDGQPLVERRSLKPWPVPTQVPGTHTLSVQLITQAGEALGNPTSRGQVVFTVSHGCAVDSDCVSEHPCDSGQCVKGICQFKRKANCCGSDSECRFGLLCVEQQCVACAQDSDCDDGNACTSDCCGEGGICYHDAAPEGCCATNADCNDGDYCTTDRCVAGTCQHTESSDPLCCNTDDDCVSDDPCQPAWCAKVIVAQSLPFKGKSKLSKKRPQVIQQCRFGRPIPGCCQADADCDDGIACTVDVCQEGSCSNTQQDGCCQTDADCFDGDACTQEACVQGQCEVTQLEPGTCCNADMDCDDGDPCTVDFCDGNGGCHHLQKKNCCASAEDCDDGLPCTTDVCTKQNQCAWLPKADCCETAEDCKDPGPCGTAVCSQNACFYKQLANCCVSDEDCKSDNPCAQGSCADNQCVFKLQDGCCTQDADCGKSGYCVEGTCKVKQPAGADCTSDAMCLTANCLSACSQSICWDEGLAGEVVTWNWDDGLQSWFADPETPGTELTHQTGGAASTPGSIQLAGDQPGARVEVDYDLNNLIYVNQSQPTLRPGAQVVIYSKAPLSGTLEVRIFAKERWARFMVQSGGAGSSGQTADGWYRHELALMAAGTYGSVVAPKLPYVGIRRSPDAPSLLDQLSLSGVKLPPAGCCASNADCDADQTCTDGACQ